MKQWKKILKMKLKKIISQQIYRHIFFQKIKYFHMKNKIIIEQKIN